MTDNPFNATGQNVTRPTPPPAGDSDREAIARKLYEVDNDEGTEWPAVSAAIRAYRYEQADALIAAGLTRGRSDDSERESVPPLERERRVLLAVLRQWLGYCASTACADAITKAGFTRYRDQSDKAGLERERDEARAERDHWKANHDNAIAIRRAVLSRPDLSMRIHPERDEFTATLRAAIARADAAEAKLFVTSAALDHVESLAKQSCAERDALAKFKAYVHQRLDDAGVPVDPPSEHREKGCRIGGRLDWLLAHVAAHEANQRDVRVEIVRLARADLAAAEQRAAKLAEALTQIHSGSRDIDGRCTWCRTILTYGAHHDSDCPASIARAALAGDNGTEGAA